MLLTASRGPQDDLRYGEAAGRIQQLERNPPCLRGVTKSASSPETEPAALTAERTSSVVNAMVDDIEKMYRQILVQPEDRDLQRIV